MKVLNIDIPVGGSLPLTPQQQALLSRGLCEEQVSRSFSLTTQNKDVEPLTLPFNISI